MDETSRTALLRTRVALPIEAELALVGACLMAVGVLGPWLVGSYALSRGLDVGDGDGIVVLLAAAVSMLALVNPFRTQLRLTGFFVAAQGAVALAVCVVHLKELSRDAVPVGWGLYVALCGSAVVLFAGLRIASRKP